MNITVFRKMITPKNGNKPFAKYVTTITDKNGNTYYCEVKFRTGGSLPNDFPCNMEIDKTRANLTSKNVSYTDKDGNDKTTTRNTLWVSEIKVITPYIDHSLDNFD